MITKQIIVLLVSLALLLLLAYLVQLEERRGQRFFASRLRAWLDQLLGNTANKLLVSWNHFSRYVLQLGWYYGLHSFFTATLRLIVSVYTYFENKFELNRSRAKRLRSEKRELSELNHLKQISEHQVTTALTETEKNQLKDKSLEGKN